MNKSRQIGLTLIETAMVIVVLGVLAAVVVPKVVRADAGRRADALSGLAATLSSSSAMNYAERKSDAGKGVAIANCGDLEKTLRATTGAGLPQSFAIDATAIAADSTVACTLTQQLGGQRLTATFTATGVY
jgi:type II secretory pathway pseudopilin PulG